MLPETHSSRTNLTATDYIHIHLLSPRGKVSWQVVHPTKAALDSLRSQGYTILGTYPFKPF